MGLFSSLKRYLANLFGAASGALEESADDITSGSTGAIKAQFRRTKEEWLKQYNEMRDAVSQIIVIREQKKNEMEKLHKEEEELIVKMDGTLIEAEKDLNNDQHKTAYERYFNRKREIDIRQEQLENEVNTTENQLKDFKLRLTDLQSEIKKLDQEEAETIADIISSKKIIELNDRISNISRDNVSQSLNVIRNKRQQLKAKAALSSELNHVDVRVIDDKYKKSGEKNTASEAFANALAARKKDTSKESQTEIKENRNI